MIDLASGSVPRRREDVREEQLKDELLIYVPEATRAVYLNGTAAVIWGLCDGQRNVGEIVGLLVEGYPEAGASIDGEVRDAIRGLVQADLVNLSI